MMREKRIFCYLVSLIIFILLTFYIIKDYSKKTENINDNNGIEDAIKNIDNMQSVLKIIM